MRFRRNDFDVTNRVNTTDPASVRLEVSRIHRSLYARAESRAMARAFDHVTALYRGEHPGYEKCDTAYHDLQHVLEVSLAMARLLDGYESSRGEGPAIGESLFVFGIVCALFHDVGYLRRSGDRRHLQGAEYTRIHVSRGGHYLKTYLPKIGLAKFASVAGPVLHFTGYERPVSAIRVPHPIYRLVGSLLGSADIIAQMADRCYLEKCRDRLYPEFVVGGITKRTSANGEETLFASGDDLLRKTPAFFQIASKRLNHDLGGTWQYAGKHFGGANLYMDAVHKNIQFAQGIPEGETLTLKRVPPDTLN